MRVVRVSVSYVCMRLSCVYVYMCVGECEGVVVCVCICMHVRGWCA